MNEAHYPPQPVIPQKPKKLKRHFILAVLGIALAMTFLGQGFGSIALGILAGFYQALVAPISGQIMFLLMYLMFFGIDFLVLLYCGLCEKPAFRSFGWARSGGQRGNTWKHFFLGLLIGCVMNGLCALLAWLHGDLDFSVGCFQFLYLFIALLCVCVQSAAEELVTRGYMMSALRERYNVWVAIAANSLLFGALHLMNDGITVLSMLTIILFGLFCSLIVYVLDSLWMSIAIHTAWNFTQSILLGLPNSGIVSEGSFLHLEGSTDSLYYDAVFGIEGSVSVVVMLTLLSAGLILYGERKKKRTQI